MAFWYFTSNDHGENKGINDSGVATFRGTPLKSLAREICQNSLDAAADQPVRIDFESFDIPSTYLPGANVLKDVFERCADYWNGQRSKMTKDFFVNAIDKITANRINVLRISDFNTKGLTGSKEIKNINTDWMRLTKSSGSSDKKGPAGGSYGIGKFAPFACSDFSTVFYNTYDIEGNCAYQGVSRLVTFEREDGETTQGIGYYGNEKNTPVFDSLQIQPSFRRNQGEYGTDVYITGYKYGGENWEDKIVVSILDGFLGAIWNEKLIVNVGDILISKDTLKDLMETYDEELTGCYAKEYYAVLTSNDTKWFEEENHMGLGKIKFGILLGNSDFHRKVAMIRQTGMKIKDGGRLSGYIAFAAVLFIEGDAINERLRLIENPEHTEWQPERSNSPIEARALIKSLNDYMKKCLEEIVENGTLNSMDATGVGSYLPDINDDSKEFSEEETISDKTVSFEKNIVERYILNKNMNKGSDQDEDNNSEIEPDGDMDGWYHNDNPHGKLPDNPPNPPYPVHPGEEGGNAKQKVVEVKPLKFKAFCMDAKNGKYLFLFTPDRDASNGYINLYLSGETEVYKAPVTDASLIGGGTIHFKDNQIQDIEFKKGVPLRISLQLDYHDYCSMEVKAYADKA